VHIKIYAGMMLLIKTLYGIISFADGYVAPASQPSLATGVSHFMLPAEVVEDEEHELDKKRS
jgi:hypothetical protein